MARANSIAGFMYSGGRIINLMSHREVEGSDTFSQQLRMHYRMVLDGKLSEVPVNIRLSIGNALKLHELHFAAGLFDFQLRRNACICSLKRLCTANDYPSVPSFTSCSLLQIPADTICRFVNDPVYGSDGAFLTPEGVEEQRQKKDFPMLKVDPPSMHLKKLYHETAQPSQDKMKQVAQAAFGHVSKVSEVEQWFIHQHGFEFLKAEARLKHRCG